MTFSFENYGSSTYLTYAVQENDILDSMSLGMITNNRIPGLAETVFSQVDKTKYVKYNISAKVSVRQFLTGIVNKKRLLGVFSGIVDALLASEEYMINPKTIIMNLDYMFADVSTCETTLICLPIENSELEETNLSAFFKTIMFSTMFDQAENCDYVAQIINYLNSSPVFSLEDFQKLIKGLSTSAVQKARTESAQNAGRQQPSIVQKSVPVQTQANPAPAIVQPSVQPAPPIQLITPPQPQVSQPKTPSQPQPTQQKEMSFFYLMNHYSKENKAIYDAQQAAKKQAKGQDKPQKEKKKDKKDKNKTPPVMPGFAIPGQEQSINQMPQQQPKQQAAPQPIAQPQPPQPSYQPAPQIGYPPVQQPVMQQPSIKGNFGETTVLGGTGGRIGETTVLNANTEAPQINPRLIRAKNNERININKPVFRIGKERSYVDYFIGDNPAISRSHANIVERNGEYFLVDTNSTNHTYINGGILQPNTEVRLSHGAKVRFANEEFEFQLY